MKQGVALSVRQRRGARRQLRRVGLAALLATAAAASTLTAAAAADTPAAAPGVARLSGNFKLSGRITVARLVPGEHVGQTVTRTWGFHANCPTGACDTETLVRNRAGGRDTVTLHRRQPGYYVGNGSFYAPLRCGSHLWRRGAVVPFTITVRITAAVLFGGPVATAVSATYTNRSRINRTPCVGVLGHDAAAYNGQVLPAAPTGGGGISTASARSPAGS